jgi:peptidoglycan hydrolase-like protein with peptidoglycan-binding domain
MAVSQNGWSANDRSVIETFTIGARTRVSLRAGDAGFLLQHYANWFDANIRDIDENYNNGGLDDWGYAERPIRGGVELSNHASGTALDINATCWALGAMPTVYLNATEIAKIHEQLKVYEGALRWGGDYDGRKDPMHVEINADAATVARVAAKLRGNPAPAPAPAPAPQPWLALADVRATPRKFQAWYNAYPFKPALLPIIKPLADNFGPQSEAALKKVQARYGLVADGIVGPLTKKLLWDLGWRG